MSGTKMVPGLSNHVHTPGAVDQETRDEVGKGGKTEQTASQPIRVADELQGQAGQSPVEPTHLPTGPTHPSSSSSSHPSGASTSTPALQLPSDTSGTVPLSLLVQRLTGQSHAELGTLLEVMPGMGGMERRKDLLDWTTTTRSRILRLLALVRGCKDAESLQKARDSVAYLTRQSIGFHRATDNLWASYLSMQHARMRNFDLATATDILGTGTYTRLPKWFDDQVAQRGPSASSRQRLLTRLGDTILLRLRTCDPPPPPLKGHWKVKDGCLSIHVPHMFRICLTLGNVCPELTEAWKVLWIECLVPGPSSISRVPPHPTRKSTIPDPLHPWQEPGRMHALGTVLQRLLDKATQGLSASSLSSMATGSLAPSSISSGPAPSLPGDPIKVIPPKPLTLLYNYLSDFCLQVQLEGMHTQARALAMGLQASPWGEGRLWPERVQVEPREKNEPILVTGEGDSSRIKTDHPLLRLYYWSINPDGNQRGQASDRAMHPWLDIAIVNLHSPLPSSLGTSALGRTPKDTKGYEVRKATAAGGAWSELALVAYSPVLPEGKTILRVEEGNVKGLLDRVSTEHARILLDRTRQSLLLLPTSSEMEGKVPEDGLGPVQQVGLSSLVAFTVRDPRSGGGVDKEVRISLGARSGRVHLIGLGSREGQGEIIREAEEDIRQDPSAAAPLILAGLRYELVLGDIEEVAKRVGFLVRPIRRTRLHAPPGPALRGRWTSLIGEEGWPVPVSLISGPLRLEAHRVRRLLWLQYPEWSDAFIVVSIGMDGSRLWLVMLNREESDVSLSLVMLLKNQEEEEEQVSKGTEEEEEEDNGKKKREEEMETSNEVQISKDAQRGEDEGGKKEDRWAVGVSELERLKALCRARIMYYRLEQRLRSAGIRRRAAMPVRSCTISGGGHKGGSGGAVGEEADGEEGEGGSGSAKSRATDSEAAIPEFLVRPDDVWAGIQVGTKPVLEQIFGEVRLRIEGWNEEVKPTLSSSSSSKKDKGGCTRLVIETQLRESRGIWSKVIRDSSGNGTSGLCTFPGMSVQCLGHPGITGRGQGPISFLWELDVRDGAGEIQEDGMEKAVQVWLQEWQVLGRMTVLVDQLNDWVHPRTRSLPSWLTLKSLTPRRLCLGYDKDDAMTIEWRDGDAGYKVQLEKGGKRGRKCPAWREEPWLTELLGRTGNLLMIITILVEMRPVLDLLHRLECQGDRVSLVCRGAGWYRVFLRRGSLKRKTSDEGKETESSGNDDSRAWYVLDARWIDQVGVMIRDAYEEVKESEWGRVEEEARVKEKGEDASYAKSSSSANGWVRSLPGLRKAGGVPAGPFPPLEKSEEFLDEYLEASMADSGQEDKGEVMGLDRALVCRGPIGARVMEAMARWV
ncbi:mediator complex subunit MED14-domain-containing protein [Piptocephalis cylindrospora]|uniref:Mediator of RNA polymerase II transcription subunit 14 n=1 Tax=Piptocephalis cylindrospora TaxID=1907219 RepID=A0A4P9Y605_9FUNG|nr:mediator complex subunit MED14-domain-containing protein [Piptocephalis cylindrospora]|eukprot:RKP14437.1 mediator complex subunit MED14-domain-containing protein [Piptocephalis cylindrospora]